MPIALISLPHLAISSRPNFVSCSGEEVSASTPAAVSRAFVSGALTAFTDSRWSAAMIGAGLDMLETVGVSFSPLTGRWSLTRDTAVNYMVTATRPQV